MSNRRLRAHRALSPDGSSDDDFESVTSSTMTDLIPSLTRGNSIASSCSAAQTDDASKIHGGYVLESNDGVLTLPHRFAPDADLLCPFQILDCEETFSDVVEFKIHVFSHFKGHTLPSFARCFLCGNNYTQSPGDDPALAWNVMLGHLVHDHFRQGQQLATIRTDFALMRWMYDRRIISDHHFKRTQLCPLPTLLPSASGGAPEVVNLPQAPSPPSAAPLISSMAYLSSPPIGIQSQPYAVFHSRRSERRRREATRPIMRRYARTFS